ERPLRENRPRYLPPRRSTSRRRRERAQPERARVSFASCLAGGDDARMKQSGHTPNVVARLALSHPFSLDFLKMHHLMKEKRVAEERAIRIVRTGFDLRHSHNVFRPRHSLFSHQSLKLGQSSSFCMVSPRNCRNVLESFSRSVRAPLYAGRKCSVTVAGIEACSKICPAADSGPGITVPARIQGETRIAGTRTPSRSK